MFSHKNDYIISKSQSFVNFIFKKRYYKTENPDKAHCK